MHLLDCVLMSVLLVIADERLLVSGSSRSISASVGEDITLNCSVDSHITPENIEEVSWKKTDGYYDILVLLYQNNEALPGSSDEQYRDRVEFFADEIPKGNFSLRLKSVRTEDKGVYMCQVFAGVLSTRATVELERLGLSFSHIMVLILCFAASGSALLLYIIIYCKSQNTDSTAAKRVRTLGFLQVFLPNIMMFVAFVLWGVTEGFLYETISCCALYILRPLMVINVAPYLEKMSECSLLSEFDIFMVVYFSVLLSRAWGNIGRFEESERITIIAVFVGVILFCVISIIKSFLDDMKMSCHGEICKWIWTKLTFAAGFAFFLMPPLQFILLIFAFGAARGGFIVNIIFQLLFFLSYSCWRDKTNQKSRTHLLNMTLWLIVMLIMTALTIYFYISALEKEKDAAGWTCTAVFLQVLWMMVVYIKIVDLDLTLAFKKMLYVFGSVGVVLLNSVALMTELILKTVNGERAVGDLRVIVFSSESIFGFSLLILSLFGPWISDMKCWQCFQDSAASDEASADGSNQNTAESHEINILLNQDQEAGRSDVGPE